MVKCIKYIGILSLIAGVINAFLDPGTAGISIASGAAGLIGCLYAAILLDTLKQIKDGINEIRENTQKPQEKANSKSFVSMLSQNASLQTGSGWICASCGFKNGSEAKFCKKCFTSRHGSQTSGPTKAVWTCKACGCKNDSTENFCNKCGMDRY